MRSEPDGYKRHCSLGGVISARKIFSVTNSNIYLRAFVGVSGFHH